MKAPDLREMYRQYASGIDDSVAHHVVEVLDIMDGMQSHYPRLISRKWGFVDVYWVISRSKKRRKLDVKTLADRYRSFEVRRLKYVSQPEELLIGKATSSDRDLFRYIEAFKLSSGISESVAQRHNILSAVLIDATS